MADFVAALSADSFDNWEICKSENLWGMVDAGTNWRSNALRVVRGDKIFIWRSGGHGFIAELEALGPIRLTTQGVVRVPWPNPGRFGAVLDVRVLQEMVVPLGDKFPRSNGHNGLKFGFSNSVLQHVFEEVKPPIGDKIRSAFAASPPPPLGLPFKSTPPPAAVMLSQPFDVDPDAVDRGLTAHHRTLEALAEQIINLGWLPRTPAPSEPQYDLAWETDKGERHVAEVKSTTQDNQEKQLRLGLGQVLRYRHGLQGAGVPVKAWLVPEVTTSDPSWAATCSDANVGLTYPPLWPGLSA